MPPLSSLASGAPASPGLWLNGSEVDSQGLGDACGVEELIAEAVGSDSGVPGKRVETHYQGL